MKTILFFALALTCMNVFAAPRLRCHTVSYLNFKGQPSAIEPYVYKTTHGIKDGYIFECLDKKGNEYTVTFQGAGLALKAHLPEERLSISCPFVKQKNLYGTYRGIRVGAGFTVGLQGGISFGKKGRGCLIGGANWSLGGVTAVVDKMIIENKWAAYDYNETVLVD